MFLILCSCICVIALSITNNTVVLFCVGVSSSFFSSSKIVIFLIVFIFFKSAYITLAAACCSGILHCKKQFGVVLGLFSIISCWSWSFSTRKDKLYNLIRYYHILQSLIVNIIVLAYYHGCCELMSCWL